MDYGKGWGDPTKYGVPIGWEFVGPDREKKHYFYLRCKECDGQHSFVKYQLGKPHSCWDCWLVQEYSFQTSSTVAARPHDRCTHAKEWA